MFKNSKVFSGFSVPDIDKAADFYGVTLGLNVKKTEEGLQLNIAGGNPIFIYHSSTNKPADFTILNFPVADIDETVDELAEKGVYMEQYDMPGIKTDTKGIARGDGTMGPRAMAWFKDPAGNILAIMQEK